MRLSLQQKEQFFHEMCELLRSGQSIPVALQLKTGARSGPMRRVAEAMLAGVSANSPAETYFAAVPGVFSEMDIEVVRGGHSAGRLEDAMGYLSEYYDALARTRRKMIINSAYPLFTLHFGAVALAIPDLVAGGGRQALLSMLWFLGAFYVSFAAVWLVFVAALRAARVNPAADQMLQSLPAIGGTRIAFVGSRFCMLMGILVKASGSILSAMNRSASASGSALFSRGAEEAVLSVQQGGYGLGAAVVRTRAFPEAIDQAFQLGEASGRLDEEMQRQATRYNEQFQSRLEILSAWLPRLIYIAIAVAIGYRIVMFYAGYYSGMASLLDSQ